MTDAKTEFVSTAAAVKGDQYLAARRAIDWQVAVLCVNTQLFLLAIFSGQQPHAWWLANGFCLANCAVGVYMLRPHYAEYLRLRALLIDVETDLNVGVTPRRLGIVDAGIGGGLLIGVTLCYLVNCTHMIIKHYFS
jgi:hypothetical protein